MLKSVLNTFFLKIISAISSFGLLSLTSHLLGANGRGAVSLILVTIGLVTLLNGFVGGAAFANVLKRNRTKSYRLRAIIVAYVWALISSAIIAFGMHIFDTIDKSILPHIFILGTLAGFVAINSMAALIIDRLTTYNATTLVVTLTSMLVFYYFGAIENVYFISHYIYSLYAAYIFAFLFTGPSVLALFGENNSDTSISQNISIIKELFKNGVFHQLSVLIYFITYRLSYYIFSSKDSYAAVGLLSVGVSLSESLWIISGSFSIVLFAKTSGAKNSKVLAYTALNYIKISNIISALGVFFLILMPPSAYISLFGSDFASLGDVLVALSVGMVCGGTNAIMLHYFAGLGLYKININILLFGLIISLVGNLFYIPSDGYIEAAKVSSLSNFIVALIYIIVFLRYNNLPFTVMLFSKSDVDIFRRYLKK